MPVTPSDDKKAFWKRIRYDPVVLNLMGWEEAPPISLATQIIMKKAIPDILQAGSKYICIYNVPSRKTQDIHFSDTVMQIDMFVPYDESDIADKAMTQIIKKCANNFTINNRPVIFDALIGDIPAPTGFYCNSVRFYYYSTI